MFTNCHSIGSQKAFFQGKLKIQFYLFLFIFERVIILGKRHGLIILPKDEMEKMPK